MTDDGQLNESEPSRFSLWCRPGESTADFAERVAQAHGPLRPEQLVKLRRILHDPDDGTKPAATNGEKPSFVYVLGHDGDNVVKIGKSDDVAGRVAGIQRMSPVKLQVLATFDVGLRLETALHARFKHLRVHGEWFDFGNLDAVTEITAAVASIKADWAAQAARRVEVEAAGEEEPPFWGAAIVGDRTLVYPVVLERCPESARCTARLKSGRRCSSYLEPGRTTTHDHHWRIAGYGLLECDRHGKGPEEIARWLAQRCRKHADADWPAFCEPEWVDFDPEVHGVLLDDDIPAAPGFTP